MVLPRALRSSFGVASDLKSCHQMVRYDALRFLIAMFESRFEWHGSSPNDPRQFYTIR